jgi:hypothetical protein
LFSDWKTETRFRRHRPDRPGADGAHAENAFSIRPHRPGLDADRRARRRQDDHGAHLARALNYETAEIDKPTVDLPLPASIARRSWKAAMSTCIEMDAASTPASTISARSSTQVRYRPVSARYKVYIIDEVHMLSNAAFNGCSRRWKNRRRM